MASFNITEIVKAAIKKAPLPESFNDLDAQSKRNLQREADAKGITVAALYSAIRAQAAADAADDFDPGAIAKSARR